MMRGLLRDHLHLDRPRSLLPLDRLVLLLLLCYFITSLSLNGRNLFLGLWLHLLFLLLRLRWLIIERDVQRGWVLQLKHDHQIILVADMHARWVHQLDQIGRVCHLDHFLDLFAN